MANLSLSRIAAFEFLIQFRSAGSGNIRRNIRGLRELTSGFDRGTRATRNLTQAQLALNESFKTNNIRRNSRELRRFSDLQEKLALRQRTARNFRLARQRVRNRQVAAARTGNSRILSGVASVFGNNSATTRRVRRGILGINTGIAGTATAAARLGPILGTLRLLFGVLAGAIGIAARAYVKFLKFNVVAVAGLGLLATGLASAADRFTNLTNRIRVASDGTRTLTQQTNDLLQVSLRSRTPFATVAELYGRVALNAKEYGISLKDSIKFSELAVKAGRIGGASTREASQAFLQLSQGLGSNRLSGDELRSVREQTPELAATIARGFKKANGQRGIAFGDLKKLGEAGELTTAAVVDAILSQEKIVNARFGRVEATFTDGISNIRSAIGFFIGSVSSAVGLGPRFFRFMDRIAQKFAKLGERGSSIGLAVSNLGEFTSIIFGSDNGFSRFTNFLSGVGSFFENIPEKIQNAANGINTFMRLYRNGISSEEAIRIAFGISKQDLIDGPFGTFVGVVGGFVTELKIFIEVTKNLGAIIERLTNAIIGEEGSIRRDFIQGNEIGASRYLEAYGEFAINNLSGLATALNPQTLFEAPSRIISSAF